MPTYIAAAEAAWAAFGATAVGAFIEQLVVTVAFNVAIGAERYQDEDGVVWVAAHQTDHEHMVGE